MGSNNPNQNPNNNINQNDNKKLNPIRRHSNIYISQHSSEIPNSKSLHSSITFHKQLSHDNKTTFELNITWGLSQQYCSNFKKSYLEGEK